MTRDYKQKFYLDYTKLFFTREIAEKLRFTNILYLLTVDCDSLLVLAG